MFIAYLVNKCVWRPRYASWQAVGGQRGARWTPQTLRIHTSGVGCGVWQWQKEWSGHPLHRFENVWKISHR